jgi:hypothetical protein
MPIEDHDFPEDAPPQEPVDDVGEGTTPFGPDPLSETPGHPTEPQRVPDTQDDAQQEDEQIPEFDPRVRDDFNGLLYLGKLQRTFEWAGHEFTIRTLTVGEIIEIGLMHKQYADSLADIKAYQAAVVAACVELVDRRPLPFPISDDPSDTPLLNRFNYVRDHWYPAVLDAVYTEYRVLEGTTAQVIAAMGKASGKAESILTSNGASV